MNSPTIGAVCEDSTLTTLYSYRIERLGAWFLLNCPHRPLCGLAFGIRTAMRSWTPDNSSSSIAVPSGAIIFNGMW